MKKWLIFLFLVVSAIAKAQYFQTGQDPSYLKWRQINTSRFQLIYPDYYEDRAQVLAGKLESVYRYASHSLGYEPRKVSVILHTQTVSSNGLVAYAPRRSEFYTTPHQGIYPLDWLEQLAVHEYRHVVQIDKVHDALPGIVNVLLGEQGTALVFGAYLPWWFIEGDAVVTETALSHYGRGRFPSFLMQHRAQVIEKGRFTYDKAYLGSYRDFVPDHYKLGYYMVGNTRERYGADLWEKVLDRVGEKPFSLTAFNKALKRETGLNKVHLYESVFDSLASVWNSEDANFDPGKVKPMSPQPENFTSYTYNHWLSNDEIVSYRTAFDRIPAFVKIDRNGKEEIQHQPGIIFEESVDFRGDWLVYSEQVPDPRWAHSGRSNIQLINLRDGQKKQIQTEYKAFAPSLSEDLSRVLMVEIDFSSNYFLSVYDVDSQQLVKRIQTSENNYFFSPRWLNQEEIVTLLLTGHGKRLAKFNLETGEYKILIDIDLGEIKHLQVAASQIYLISSYTGKDAPYVFKPKNNTIEMLYEPRFGAAYPAINSDGNILLSDYTADGYRLIQLDSIQKVSIEQLEKAAYPLANTMSDQELGIPDLTINDTVRYPSENYPKAVHLFNFHSWAPFFADSYNFEFLPGVSFASQNKLGTAETLVGYRWYTSEKTGQFYARYIYKGWYPVLDFQIRSGKRASSYSDDLNHLQTIRYTWSETGVSAATKLPLNFGRGKFHRTFQPELKYEYFRYSKTESTPDGFHVGDYQSLAYRLYFHQLLRRSYQDLQPDFGWVLNGSLFHSIGTKNLGKLAALQSIVYLPGIMANHGLKLYGGAQKRFKGDFFSFSDAVLFPRGWLRTGNLELVTASADYKFPLINPDFSIGGLAYIKRVNTSIFFDRAYLLRNTLGNGQQTDPFSQTISSFGVEVTGEINALRFYAPIQLGVRVSYLPEIENTSIDLILSIDFTSL